MQPKLILSDIDGTLLNSDRDLSEITIEQVKRIVQKIPFLLVSARMPKQMVHLQQQLGIQGSPMICYNGALVVHGLEILHSQEIDMELAEQLVDFNSKTTGKVHISLFHNDQWYAEAYDDWAKREENNTKTKPEIRSNTATLQEWREQGAGAHKIMCMGDEKYIDRVFQFLRETMSEKLNLYRSKETYLEISNKKVSKLTGIQRLIAECYPEVMLADVMTFGDNYNDVAMTQAVGYGIAVANARQEVLDAAKEITLHHKEDGVAHFLQKMTF
ncbi:MAG: HAD family hydrolase [Capnocytophaga sp.]|nr:HAD family hydrolase [Capnocytophaga sp.]